MPLSEPPYRIPDGQVVRSVYQLGGAVGRPVVVRSGADLHSENFVTGSAGWQIDADGNVEFNDGTFRGSLDAVTGTLGALTVEDFITLGTGGTLRTATSGHRTELRTGTFTQSSAVFAGLEMWGDGPGAEEVSEWPGFIGVRTGGDDGTLWVQSPRNTTDTDPASVRLTSNASGGLMWLTADTIRLWGSGGSGSADVDMPNNGTITADFHASVNEGGNKYRFGTPSSNDTWITHQADGGTNIDGPGILIVVDSIDTVKFGHKDGDTTLSAIWFGEVNDALVYDRTAEQFEFWIGDVEQMRLSNDQLLVPDGSEANPGLALIDDSDTGISGTAVANQLGFSAGGAWRLLVDNGAVKPGSDNTISSGTGSFRWSEVFAAIGTINTSDQRVKILHNDQRLGLDFLLDIDGEAFTRTDLDDGRYHHGVLAQDVINALRLNGHEPDDHAFVRFPDDPGGLLGVAYDQFWGPQLNANREFHERLQALEAAVL